VPTRKQRRRRDKEFRHGYELVTYDESGNEVPLEAPEKPKEPAKSKAKTSARGLRPKRPPREVKPPSWDRALKRGGLWSIGVFAFVILFKWPLALGVIYGVALIPFTYWIDRIAYRNYLRRSGKS
jgi:hypothetical protein